MGQMNKMSLDEKFEVGDALGTSNNISSNSSSSSVSSGSVTSGTVSEPVKFVVKSTDPRHHPSASSGSSSTARSCYAPAQEATSEWVETIKQILQSQRDFLKAIQSPIKYQNEQQRLSTIGKDV